MPWNLSISSRFTPIRAATLRLALLSWVVFAGIGCSGRSTGQADSAAEEHRASETAGSTLPAASNSQTSSATSAVSPSLAGTSDGNPAPAAAALEDEEHRYAASRFYIAHDKFLSADAPEAIPAREALSLLDSNEVLGLVVGEKARAYPVRMISYHHVVNDELAGQPVVVTYCVICSSGIAFDPRVDERRLTFGFHGIYQGTAVLYDKQTGSLWLHITGRCIQGPLKGKRLQPIALRHLTFGEWKKERPETEVMAENPRFYGNYFPERKARRGLDYFPPEFPGTIQTVDSRLKANELVFGVFTDLAVKAYPFSLLGKVAGDGVINDRVGDLPVVIWFDKQSQSAGGLARRIGGKTLVFARQGEIELRDRESGAIFNRQGLCLRGMYQGQRLPMLSALQSEWYGWFANFPATELWRP